ncbi:MAG: xanthine dehydrogenase family protein subunit M, partial [SAR202 cluster bacterium]|nr:xanthine dehydrogenase family protein subunit M [SAR202 cluster bacterium]
DSVADAVRLLRKTEGAKIIAGGHTLIPLMKLRLVRPATLIDIGRIAELKGVTVSNGTVTIGALTTHATLASSADVRRAAPLLAEAASVVGDPAVRNRGTIGGNVVHADPGSDLPTALTALGATFNVQRARSTQAVPVSRFFKAFLETAVGQNEVLVSVEVPAAQPGQGAGYAKMFHPASRYALVSAAAVLTVRGGQCTAASVAVGGLVPTARRAAAVERALAGKPLTTQNIADAARRVTENLGDNLIGDLHASAEYRRAMAIVYVQRALTGAAGRAGR